ncbi:hypothetical protein WDU94_008398 [Cyamophila willieti]
MRGMRHGYGVRASAPFGLASHYKPTKNLRASMTSLRSNEKGESGMASGSEAAAGERDRRVDDSRGGFVLRARSDDVPQRRRSLVEKSSNIKKSILSGLKIKKQRSTGDLEKRGHSGGSMRSTASSASWVSTESSHSGSQGHVAGSVNDESNASFLVEDEHMDANVTETYMGEWKNDKRAGFGISERSDGLKYEGEWFGNKKYGYGITTFKDGTKEEGKYKNNVLITSQKKKHIFLMRSAKFRERIDAAVNAAQRAYKIALQKADIAISRMATARGKAELADLASDHAREDYEIAKITAKQFAPDFSQPAMDKLKPRDYTRQTTQGLAPGPSLDQLSTTTSAPTHTKLPSTELPPPSNPTEQLPMPSQIGNRLPMPGQPRPAQQPIQPQSKYSTQQPYSMGHGGQSSRSQTPTHMYQQTPPVAPKNPNSVQKPNSYPQSQPQHQTHSPNQNLSFDQNQYYQQNQNPSQNYSQNQNPNLNYNQNQNPSQNYSQNQNPNLNYNQNQNPSQNYSQNPNYPNPQSLQTQNYPDAQSSFPNHIPYNQNPSFPPPNPIPNLPIVSKSKSTVPISSLPILRPA